MLKWTREGGNLPAGRAIDNGLGYLLFSNLDTSDSGVYVCTASDGYSAISEKKTLAVGGTNEHLFIYFNIKYTNIYFYSMLSK